ncbi:hypothetical protein D8674_014915 [Pyrus ussuriensis x Pyrus communis]|uniref:Uncharacterized protein n=1 Tax=Pyrus ussuriensis x Pyrus communis TaxID=2448454 RepID=A0A5N5GTU6_9ROSA|nr:hypothetical protein D8674_014915 [Pyrus ussuriensis x Pyrus communis]
MADATEEQDNHHVHPLLESLKKASKDLQSNPISIIYNNYDINAAIEALLELGTKADPIISGDPSLFTLNQLLSNLKTLLEKLQKLQGYGLRSLSPPPSHQLQDFPNWVRLEAEVQAHIDRKNVWGFVKTMEEDSEDDWKVKALMILENRLNQGFDKDYQELILRAKVFSILEFITYRAALAVLALVKFNKDVFVGLVLMGPIVRALIQMGSSCSIQVLTWLVKIIRTPLVDESMEKSQELSASWGRMTWRFERRDELRSDRIDAWEDLIEKLMNLQRLETKMEEGEGKFPFSRCVAGLQCWWRLAGLEEQSEKRGFKMEILRRVREASVSDAEAASVVAEVLWGSSP